MGNIHDKLQLEKSNCLELQKEINFFDELISDIEMRQVLFEKFEKYLVSKKIDNSFPDRNDFCRMIVRGYLIQQLLDFAKFFDKNDKVYSFNFIVKHGANSFKEKHNELFNIWKGHELESVRNKIFAHSQKDYTNSSVEKKGVDDFINKTIILFKDIINDLEKKYSISSTHFEKNDNYLIEVANDVEDFFNTLAKNENN